MCQLLWWFVFWCLNSFLTACVLLMFFHAVSYTFFFLIPHLRMVIARATTYCCRGVRTWIVCKEEENMQKTKKDIYSALIRTQQSFLRFWLARIRTHTTRPEASKSTPHLRRTHIFSSISWMSHSSARMWKLMRFLRTHPHWSARIVHLCIRAGC